MWWSNLISRRCLLAVLEARSAGVRSGKGLLIPPRSPLQPLRARHLPPRSGCAAVDDPKTSKPNRREATHMAYLACEALVMAHIGTLMEQNCAKRRTTDSMREAVHVLFRAPGVGRSLHGFNRITWVSKSVEVHIPPKCCVATKASCGNLSVTLQRPLS